MSRSHLKHIDSNIPRPDVRKHPECLLILHDQLNVSKFPQEILARKPVLIFIESFEKGNSLPYHKHKLTYVLSSQRHFALECHAQGFPVCYHSTKGHYDDGLQEVLAQFESHNVTFMTPNEWDTRERLRKVKKEYPDRITEISNSFFLADANEWASKIASGYRMEFFYREMRKQTGYLMNEGQPEGGEWNYDKQNRKSLPKNITLPEIPKIEPDEITKEVQQLIEEVFPNHFGYCNGFSLAVDRKQALALADDFFEHRFANFGPYEDALKQDHHVLFHSMLSVYLNNGLLLPEELCERALKAYRAGKAPLNSVEGYIRQLIGWREYIRVYYEALMPDIREANHFGFTRALPDFFWTGETKMNCVAEAVKPVLKMGYSHHIPRLMILSNIANLTETDPQELNKWFWFAYVDAYEWVTLPNVLGMSTFADGGILASKPYVSGGNYINKMSDHCKNCSYKISKKTGEEACPFNYLYWNFVDKHREDFEENGRVSFMVNMFEKKSDAEKEAIRSSSETFIDALKRSQ